MGRRGQCRVADKGAWRRFVCRVLGHSWGSGYREPDGYPLGVCTRCHLTETWAGGMLVTSTDWRESERLNAKEAA